MVRRGIKNDATCPRCGSEEESILHMILKCEDAKKVWYGSPLRINADRVGCCRFDEWVEELDKQKFEDEWWNLFWMVCWHIWLARNAWVFDKKCMPFMEVGEKAVRGSNEFVAANERVEVLDTGSHSPPRWYPPPMDVYKLNTDAAVFKSHQIGCGGVVRDSVGEVVMATSKLMDGIVDPEVAEALSARHGMQTALEAGYSALILEVDCVKLFNYLKAGRSESSPFGRVVQDILNLAAHCSCIRYSHVRRQGNVVAHTLAKISKELVGWRVWLEGFPHDIANAVMVDLHE